MITVRSLINYGITQGFDNMIKRLQKHGHKLVLTRLKPEVLLILLRMGCDFHIHQEGVDMKILLTGISVISDVRICKLSYCQTMIPLVAELSTTVEENKQKNEAAQITSVDIHEETL